MDRTFPPDDERAFVVPVRDLELLARAGWESAFPAQLNEESILNADDLPDEMAEAFARTPAPLVQCAACRRLCVRDDFVWKEKQLCAWDYHGQAFGKRGPWRETPYESRHFETLASCAYVAPELLEDLNVEALLNVAGLDESTMQAVVNTLLEHDGSRSHMAVRTRDGVVVLREK
ncbi:MAG: hypothetical protein JOZ77_00315 [Candidatus Eremiobacteraeota bacterium]|nr:hypothetical protein [Candidatus Eremiobacteraeota bacterium]